MATQQLQSALGTDMSSYPLIDDVSKAKSQEDIVRLRSQATKDLMGAEKNELEAKQRQQQIVADEQSKFAQKESEIYKRRESELKSGVEKSPIPEFIPTKDNAKDMAEIFGLIGVIGMVLGHGGGRQSALGAMNSMTGMMRGYQQGRADLYKRERDEFEKNFKAMKIKHEELYKQFESAIKRMPYDLAGAKAQMDAAIAASGSDVLRATYQKQGPMRAMDLLKQADADLKNIADRKLRIQLAAQQQAHAERMHRENLAQRERLAGSGPKAAQQKFIAQRTINALGGVTSSAESIMQLPEGSNISLLNNLKTKDGMMNFIRNSALRKTTDDENRAIETLFSGVSRYLATIEASGTATGLTVLSKQLEKLSPVAGDTAFSTALKMADIRRISTESIRPMVDAGLLDKQQTETAMKLLDRMEKAIPFTTNDVVQARFGGKGKTLGESGKEISSKHKKGSGTMDDPIVLD